MELNDKIKGALFGFALGDALGLGSEFMTRREVEHYYPEKLRHFDQIIQDAHRCQWKPGEWTNDTEIMVRMLESILEEDGFHIHKIAQKFKIWFDSTERDISIVYRALCNDPEWAEHPIKIAHKLWHESGLIEASNEAIQRVLVSGLTSHPDNLMEDTRRLVLMTNDDSRCVATTMIVAYTANTILHQNRIPGYDELAAICYKIDTRTLPWLEKAYRGTIEDLELDDENTLMWTRKAMAAALWSLWHTNSAEEGLYAIIDAGGDADTNAAIGGGLLGLKYGYEALPAEKEKLLRFDYLNDLVDRVTDYVRRHKTD